MYNFIDLFCGAGGTSSGFRDAGFNVVLGVDVDEHALSTFNKNFKNKGKNIDMFSASGEDILKAANVSREEVDVLIGCPPCQGYSKLSGDAGKNDPRNILVKRFAELVEYIKPLFITFENVPGVVEKTGCFDEMIHILHDSGYEIKKQIVDMREYGVPQRRKRMVVVGCRDSDIFSMFSLPKPTNSKNGGGGLERYRTVKEALYDLPPLASGQSDRSVPNHVSMNNGEIVLKRIKSIPKDGGSLKDAPVDLQYACHKGKNRGYNDVFGRMRWDVPSPTITAGCYNPTKGRFIHPEQNRGISLREAARLQTFADDFVFTGGVISVSKQIGNAFPPHYAKMLAESIKIAIETKDKAI